MMMVRIIKASVKMTKTLNPVSVANLNLNETTKTEKVDSTRAIIVSIRVEAVAAKTVKVIGTAMHVEAKRTLLGARNAIVAKQQKAPKETLMEVSTEVVVAVDKTVKEIGIVTVVVTRKTFRGVMSAIVVKNPNQLVQVAAVVVAVVASENHSEATIEVADSHLVVVAVAAVVVAVVAVSTEVVATEALAATTVGRRIRKLHLINPMIHS